MHSATILILLVQIVVMSGGVIVEEGSHSEVLLYFAQSSVIIIVDCMRGSVMDQIAHQHTGWIDQSKGPLLECSCLEKDHLVI